MLSPQQLNRVSNSYRLGYMAGFNLQPRKKPVVEATDSGIPLKPFAVHDYEEGFKSGRNDRYWGDFYSKQTKLDRQTWMAEHA